MGWIFWRCWGSNYISDKDECLNDLIAKLDSLKIDPIGFKATTVCGVSDHRTVGEFDTDLLEDKVEPEVAEEPEQEIIMEPEPIVKSED
jgi:hypothetical protein